MDVGSLFGAITGGGNPKVEIHVNAPQQGPCVILDHMPSWRLHKNPFWRVKHPAGDQFTLSSSASTASLPSQQQSTPPLQQQPPPYGTPQQQQPYGQQQQQQPYGVHQQQQPYNINPPPGSSMPPNLVPEQAPQMPSSASSYGTPQGYPSPAHALAGSQLYPPNMTPQPYQTQQQSSKEVVYAFDANQDIVGSVVLRLPHNKKCEHLGIKVQFIGRIDMTMGGMHEGRPHYDFTSLSKELCPPGVLYQPETVIPFHFKNMEKELESYRGRNVACRYMVKVVMERKFLPPLTKEHDVWVQLMGQPPQQDESIKMEVGIEDCLHIEFEYDRRHYHLTDTIRGKIHFLLVRIKIKHMELAVLRRETSGEGVAAAAAAAEGTRPGANVDASNICTETQTLVKYEIMDGAPVKGEVIPVKLCLKGIPADLTPTYTAVNNRFSVRYYLNLVLVDEDDRRYFKQQEIILWRRELGS